MGRPGRRVAHLDGVLLDERVDGALRVPHVLAAHLDVVRPLAEVAPLLERLGLHTELVGGLFGQQQRIPLPLSHAASPVIVTGNLRLSSHGPMSSWAGSSVATPTEGVREWLTSKSTTASPATAAAAATGSPATARAPRAPAPSRLAAARAG